MGMGMGWSMLWEKRVFGLNSGGWGGRGGMGWSAVLSSGGEDTGQVKISWLLRHQARRVILGAISLRGPWCWQQGLAKMKGSSVKSVGNKDRWKAVYILTWSRKMPGPWTTRLPPMNAKQLLKLYRPENVSFGRIKLLACGRPLFDQDLDARTIEYYFVAAPVYYLLHKTALKYRG